MYKKMACMTLMLIFSWIILEQFSITVKAAENVKEDGAKLIYILYDNSSSTYEWKGSEREYWSEINYGVRAFYAMTDKKDKIKIFYMATQGAYRKDDKTSEILEFNGYSRENAKAMQDISGTKICVAKKSVTHLSNVIYAIEELGSKQVEAEKWIVIFTDGQLEDDNANVYPQQESANAINSKLIEYPDINACYIPISAEAVNIYLEDSLVFQPQDTGDIAKQLLEVCNYIYGRRSVRNISEMGYQPGVLQDSQLEISFDIPISKCILYAYCGNATQGKLQGENILWQECIQTPSTVYWSDGTSDDNTKYNEKTGFIAELSTDPKQNNSGYTITFPHSSTNIEYEIYYEPAISVIPQVLQSRDDTAEGKYLAGDYEVSLAFNNKETGESIAEDAHFLSAEQFEVDVISNGQSQRLSKSLENGRWQGSIAAGDAVIAAFTTGIRGETKVEFFKDYAKAKLVATLDEIYLMDQLDERKQYISLQAILDGENITEEIQKLIERDEEGTFSYGLNRNGVRCDSIDFESEYDTLACCWKLYPVFKNQIDYSVSGAYTFDATLEMGLNYYNNTTSIGLDQNDIFRVGILEKEILVQIENPWICKISAFCIPSADEARISFLWNGQVLPAEVIGDIVVNGTEVTQSDILYQVVGQNKDILKLQSQKRGGFLFQSDVVDRLTIEGEAVLFGVECKIYDDNIGIEIHALSRVQRWAYIGILLLPVAILLFVVIKIIKYIRDYNNGKRFWIGVKVFRSYPKGKNRLEGRVIRRRRRDKYKERYTEYILSCELPEEFQQAGKDIKIKVRCLSKTRIDILSLQKPHGCTEILLGSKRYTDQIHWMSPEDKISLKGEKSIIEINLENY